jgi:lipopolysaccharide/colanic/teichoic acid biosynthesis glycosyltransferase
MGELNLETEYSLDQIEGFIDEFEKIYDIDDRGWIKNTKKHVSEDSIDGAVLAFLLRKIIWFQKNSKIRRYLIFKRMFDVSLSVFLLLSLSPFYPLVYLAIRMTSSGPAFYSQIRIGKYGQPFWIYKFRTMYSASEMIDKFADQSRPNTGLQGDYRVTSIGNILRFTSIDELPQLLNVFFGQMSFVGPRPLSPDDSSLMAPSEFDRLNALPGLTGLWQVLDRFSTDGRMKLKMDSLYSKHRSISLDLKILALTVPLLINPHKTDRYKLTDFIKST